MTFDGGGTTYFGGISFEAGAHDQTWDGFNFANGEATWHRRHGLRRLLRSGAPHHITLRNISSCGLTGEPHITTTAST